MLKHCTNSTIDLRARPIQNFANEANKLGREGPGNLVGNRKTSLVTTHQIGFEGSPKLGRHLRYRASANRTRSHSLEPSLPPSSCPASPSLSHRSTWSPGQPGQHGHLVNLVNLVRVEMLISSTNICHHMITLSYPIILICLLISNIPLFLLIHFFPPITE